MFNFALMLMTFSIGISGSLNQIIGSSLGARDFNRAKSYGYFMYKMGFPIALLFSILLYVG